MKKIKFYISTLLVGVLGLSACDSDDLVVEDRDLLSIEVFTNGFGSENATTRAADNESEFKTTLVANDRIGIYVIKDGNSISKNIPCKYDGSQWIAEGEVLLIGSASYFAYYPYRTEMSSKTITSINDIVSNFDVASDQSTYTLYTANDLMTGTASLNAGTKTLTFMLNHALSLVVIDLKGEKVTYTGGYTAYEAVNAVAKKQIGNVTSPYQTSDGAYRALVKAGNITPDISYTAGGKTITYNSAITAVAGKYSKRTIYTGNKPGTQSISVGDYFYSDGSISSANNVSGKTCIGIVYKLGVGNGDDIGKYAGSRLTAIHGYVVSLSKSESRYLFYGEYGRVATGHVAYNHNSNEYRGYYDTWQIINSAPINGLSNLTAVNREAVFHTINYTPAAPAISSGWYLPSTQQLTDVKDNSSVSSKLVGDNFFRNIWTSGTRSEDNYAVWCTNHWQNIDSTNDDYWTCHVLPFLTF